MFALAVPLMSFSQTAVIRGLFVGGTVEEKDGDLVYTEIWCMEKANSYCGAWKPALTSNRSYAKVPTENTAKTPVLMNKSDMKNRKGEVVEKYTFIYNKNDWSFIPYKK